MKIIFKKKMFKFRSFQSKKAPKLLSQTLRTVKLVADSQCNLKLDSCYIPEDRLVKWCRPCLGKPLLSTKKKKISENFALLKKKNRFRWNSWSLPTGQTWSSLSRFGSKMVTEIFSVFHLFFLNLFFIFFLLL